MLQEPLVSVIIPSYNHENFVQYTINSIINQSYKNIELIMIDDGSTDSSWEKINELQEQCEGRFKNFIAKKQENQGTCLTLNSLIELSTGKYIYLIASDDKAFPLAIEKMVHFLESDDDYCLCVGDNEFIDADDNVRFWDEDQNLVSDENNAAYKTFSDFLKTCGPFDENFGNYETLRYINYIPNGYLIRRSIFEKTGMFRKDAPLEDWWIMMQMSKYAKFKYIDEVLFSYRWHNTNTIKNREKMEKFYFLTNETEIERCHQIDLDTLLPRVRENIDKAITIKSIGLFNLVRIHKKAKMYSIYFSFCIFNYELFRITETKGTKKIVKAFKNLLRKQ